jgi:hypothetical protein
VDNASDIVGVSVEECVGICVCVSGCVLLKCVVGVAISNLVATRSRVLIF